ncbi:hypothetical protein [Deinococcus yavapaiensis]|uniref:Leucine rich repeat (LRR) protein n=1 Tax=Deinococcus yavapaiensis KR-236 TaxID=694435 RepID=A0A318SJ83_9DEIO|nr:hypothetical protein [Deinococcus yavapaiensis]PYE51993.1 hypothetical protein DES52_11339 [Deinococcus yavapaiensis KR-236]
MVAFDTAQQRLYDPQQGTFSRLGAILDDYARWKGRDDCWDEHGAFWPLGVSKGLPFEAHFDLERLQDAFVILDGYPDRLQDFGSMYAASSGIYELLDVQLVSPPLLRALLPDNAAYVSYKYNLGDHFLGHDRWYCRVGRVVEHVTNTARVPLTLDDDVRAALTGILYTESHASMEYDSIDFLRHDTWTEDADLSQQLMYMQAVEDFDNYAFKLMRRDDEGVWDYSYIFGALPPEGLDDTLAYLEQLLAPGDGSRHLQALETIEELTPNFAQHASRLPPATPAAPPPHHTHFDHAFTTGDCVMDVANTRWLLAQHPRTPPRVLARFALHDDERVRHAAWRNPSTSTRALHAAWHTFGRASEDVLFTRERLPRFLRRIHARRLRTAPLDFSDTMLDSTTDVLKTLPIRLQVARLERATVPNANSTVGAAYGFPEPRLERIFVPDVVFNTHLAPTWPHFALRERAAESARTSETALLALARDEDVHVRRAVLRNPRATETVLRALQEEFPELVARHPRASISMLLALSQQPNEDVALGIAMHPGAPWFVLHNVTRRTKSFDRAVNVALALANNHNTAAKNILELLQVAHTKAFPPTALQALQQRARDLGLLEPPPLQQQESNREEDEACPDRWLQRIQAEQPNAVRAVRLALKESESTDEAAALLVLCTDERFEARRAAALHPALPERGLRWLARNDETYDSERLRNLVAQHPNVPLDVLIALCGDESTCVAALHNPRVPSDVWLWLLNDTENAPVDRIWPSCPYTPPAFLHVKGSVRATRDSLAQRQAVAAHPNTADTTLLRLALDKHLDVRETVARRMNLPPDLIARLMQEEGAARATLVKHPHLPRSLLEAAYADDDDVVRATAIGGLDTPRDVLARASEDASWHVRFVVAQHPSTPSVVLHRLSFDTDENVRFAVASHPATHAVTLAHLALTAPRTEGDRLAWRAQARHFWTRRLVAGHPSTPRDVRRQLERHSEAIVRAVALSHPATPARALRYAAFDRSELVRQVVAAHRNTPLDLHDRVLARDTERVRAALACAPRTSTSILSVLAYDTAFSVRAAVAQHPHTSSSDLRRLINDAQPVVRDAAALRWQG